MPGDLNILALDIGDRTCGVAATDALGVTAQPLKTLRYKGTEERKAVFAELAALLRVRGVGTVVAGLPLNMNGSEGPQAAKVREFVAAFQNFLAKSGGDPQMLRWEFWDERLSSAGAERSLIEADLSRGKRKKVIDTMAAVFILQGYLDSLDSFR